ncbi:MAG: hypothetical protein RAK22_03015, partial [Nanoarchaeota archaeon]|nr:hypothetical protein [Nanoarchaeota archaeon]
MHQTENVDPTENALNKLFASVELLSSKIDELNERVDFLNSFIGIERGEGEEKITAEPPGQLAGLSFNILGEILQPQDANDLRAYFIRVLGMFHRYK